MQMKIKSGLAPMAGFTDIPFRELATSLGADYTVTEMVSAAAVCFGDAKTCELARISDRERYCALQLFGHDPDMMYEAILKTYSLASVKPSAYEINMGCPVKKIVSSGDGSALMKTPDVACRLAIRAKRAAERIKLPLWIKIRAGWDSSSKNAPEFAKMLADAGADRITVHGRTREQMYSPSSDNGVIAAVREALPDRVEVIGNGDISSYGDAVRMISETGCDGVLIGRAALGDPWIFGDISSLGDCPPVTEEERISTAVALTEELIKLNGEYSGIRIARGRAAHFIKGMRGSSSVRDRLNHAETFDEFKKILEHMKEQVNTL